MEKSHKIKLCKAAGCSVDVATLSTRCNAKKNICDVHMRASSMRCRGKGHALFRYCQQCGKLEQLELFSGDSHSCRASLARRRSSRAGSYHLRCQQQQQQQQGDSFSSEVSVQCNMVAPQAAAAAAAAAGEAMDVSQLLSAGRTASCDSNNGSSMHFELGIQWPAAAQAPATTPAAAASAGRKQHQQQQAAAQEVVLSGPVLHTGFFEAQLQQELANSSMPNCPDAFVAADSDMAALDEQIMLLERELLHSAAADRHAACHTMKRLPAHAAAGSAYAGQDATGWQVATQQQQQRQFSLRQQELDEQLEQHRQASLLVEQQLRLVQQQVGYNSDTASPCPAAADMPAGVPAMQQVVAGRMQCATSQSSLLMQPHNVADAVSNTVSNKFGRGGEGLAAMHARLGGLTAEYRTLESSLLQLQLLLGGGAAPAAPAAAAGVSGSMTSSGVSGGSCIGGAAGRDIWGCQQQQQQQQQQDMWQEPPAQPQLPLPIASCGVYSNGVCFFV